MNKEYTTERGVTIGVTPIPMLLDEIRKANPIPGPFTYVEELAGGGKLERELTDAEAAVWAQADPGTWAEHAARWEQYRQDRDAAQELLNDRIWQAIVRSAIVVTLPEDESWIDEHLALGLEVPTDHRKRMLHYIRTEAIGGMRDVLKITAMANGADMAEGALLLAESSFRDSLARSLLRGLEDRGGSVGAGDAGRIDAAGEGVAPET